MASLYQGSRFLKGNAFVDPKGSKLIFEKNTKRGKIFVTDKGNKVGLTEGQVNRLKLINEDKEDVFDNCLRDERVLFLSGEVTNDNVKNIITEMINLDRTMKEDIILFINSIGGSIDAGLALYDIMNLLKNDIITVCTGVCASMGAIIFINGTKGKRYMLSNSEVMIHQASSDFSGKYSEVEQSVKSLKQNNEKLLKIISEKTGTPIETIKNDVASADKWFNSSNAIGYGLADKIIYSIDEIY